MTERYNQKNKNSTFLNELKNADISLVYKGKDHHDKSNYRPVSIRILYEQIDNHTKDIISNISEDFERRSAPSIHH